MRYGTHNSATGGQLVWWLRPLAWLVILTSKCQTKSIAEQLEDGVRLFNLQVTKYNGEWVFSHGTAIYKEETPTVSIELPNLADNTAGTLNVYTESGFAPYEFVNDNNEVIGVDMYLMSLVCEELNMQLKITDMLFDGICGKVATEDNAIGAAGITINPERQETLDFSNPYFSSMQYIISKEDQAFTKLSQLAGKKIGVQKGTTGAFMVEEAINNGELKDTGATMVEYESGPVAYTALKTGKIDFVVLDKLPALSLVG
jgi:ABC-type amino acid transport substrate-binding protein